MNADWLKHQLLLRGWTQKDLARHARISEFSVARAVKWKFIQFSTFRKILRAIEAEPINRDLEATYADAEQIPSDTGQGRRKWTPRS
jgi:DNA-binding Xre family transcriptional regulator